jgi:VanZ family protein
MEKNLFYESDNKIIKHLWLLPGILVAVLFGWLIAGKGFAIAGVLVILPIITCFLILVFLYPRIGLISYIVYSFLAPALGRHVAGLQVGLGFDALLVLTWLGVIFYKSTKYRFRHLNNDMVWLPLAWFILTVLQIGNPSHPNIVGWLQEMRNISLYWLLVVPLTMLIFRKKSDVLFFIDLIIIISFIAALYGMKQLYIGLDDAEKVWLNDHLITHWLFGKLRVFSFYVEAGQFGASQASIAIMCFILALGPHSTIRRVCYALAGCFIFYGMLLSGTRGALGGIVGGGFIYIVLSKQIKIIIIGGVLGLGFIGMLKFTKIGNGNDQIKRMRSGTDANDPSFQLRMINQRKLSDALSSKPLGTGVGTIGAWGQKYNKHIPTSTIAPDSLYVKIWVMYGIVGFIFWFGTMLYILGKSAGLIWNTRDPVLRNQLCALCAVYAAILLCSYGNEVMNAVPSLAIVYVSWALISMSTRWDTPLQKSIAS